jgi:hypothetical protein
VFHIAREAIDSLQLGSKNVAVRVQLRLLMESNTYGGANFVVSGSKMPILAEASE